MTKKSIFIVEDDADIRQSMSDILQELGYTVGSASNGLDALTQLREMKEHPGVIILDLMMPVLDGMGFRKEQEKDQKLFTIPTVLLSADSRLPIKAKENGFQEFVKKPIELEHLIAIAEKYCG